MPISNFATANQTFRLVMANGITYTVPPFQRDYSWAEEEWDDLWLDIQNVLRGEDSAHYMGYLVLQTEDNKNFIVIDGQQRLTTLSIVLLAVLKTLQELIDKGEDPRGNKQRKEQLYNQFIGYLDPVTLVARPKLTLNRNCNSYFRDYLVPLRDLPRYRRKTTEHLMRRAFEWFHHRLKKTYSTGPDLARFVEQMADLLFFTVITVTDELNAYKVFETLNARGVRLSSTDLLKNYLFSLVSRERASEDELNALERRWEELVTRLGSERFPDFVRTHWNSRHKLIRHSELFKKLRAEIKNRGDAFELLSRLEEDLEIFIALRDPFHERWAQDARGKAAVWEFKLFGVRQVFPLLLAAHRRFSEEEFSRLLRCLSLFSFRYQVIGNLPPNELEVRYNALATRISDGTVNNLRPILDALHPLYPKDPDFLQDFKTKSFPTTQNRNKKIVRYILSIIEGHVANTALDPEDSKYSLEHILPENPQEGWEEWEADKRYEEWVFRLGNMTLLESSLNREIGNASFQRKLEAYRNSNITLTRMIAERYDQWVPAKIEEWQGWLAQQATAVWRISQYDESG